MASGKTRHLLTEIDTLRKYGHKKIAVFKPRTDTRSGMNILKSRKGDEDSAEEISATNPAEIWEVLRTREYDILASGLAFDFRGEPFGSTPDLALLAEDRCMWMTAYCTRCGARAPYPQRIINGTPAHYNSPQILVGGDETYEPRCDDHFVLPGRTLPGWEDTSPQRRIWPAVPETP